MEQEPLTSGTPAGSGGGYQSIEGGSDDVHQYSPTTVRLYSVGALYDQAKEAKLSSQGCCDFFFAFIGLLISSLVWTVILIITLTLPIVMIVLGAMYIYKCDEGIMIPIFNIVGGSVLTVSNIMNMAVRCRRYPDNAVPTSVNVVGWITVAINCFLVGWFIAGCFWVYGLELHREIYYCNRIIYTFTFWLLNSVFLFFGTLCVAAVIMAFFVLIFC